MLRFFVLALLLLNSVYFAWSQGLLQALDWAPVQQTEPQRLAQQIRPEALRLLSVSELREIETAPAPKVAAKPTVCLQAGLLDEAQAAALRSTLASTWPNGSWALDLIERPARWIVYMGRYASADARVKKRAELASLNLQFEPLNNPALEWGLSLGGFDTQAAANVELGALSRRGVRTARVVQERAEVRGVMLRLPMVDEALRARLDELKPALAGMSLGSCR